MYLNPLKNTIPWFTQLLLLACGLSGASAEALKVGFAEKDITPEVSKQAEPVWMAGYGPGRRATSVHDPIMVRAMVLQHESQRYAIASVDLIGLQNDLVRRIRERLPGYLHITVASTHNHASPDVIGIWGETIFKRGANEAYLQNVVDRTVECIETASKECKEVSAKFGTAEDATLLDDSRLPHVKDGVLRTLHFLAKDGMYAGIFMQWNCHPEALDKNNKALTADFPAVTVDWLKKKYACPVVYVSGAVGGLMTPPNKRVRDANGQEMKSGGFEYSKLYGEEVAKLAAHSIEQAEDISLTPFRVSEKQFALPIANRLYRLARQLGVLKRQGRVWAGSADQIGEIVLDHKQGELTAIVSETSLVSLGDLAIANIPGELYPELVYGNVQEPPDANADFPDAAVEPSIDSLLEGKKWMLIGLASDEVGYIIPKRQWDDNHPFCYERDKAQYGEINSCGPETAPVVMKAFADCVKAAGAIQNSGQK